MEENEEFKPKIKIETVDITYKIGEDLSSEIKVEKESDSEDGSNDESQFDNNSPETSTSHGTKRNKNDNIKNKKIKMDEEDSDIDSEIEQIQSNDPLDVNEDLNDNDEMDTDKHRQILEHFKQWQLQQQVSGYTGTVPRKRIILKAQARKMVFDVFCYMCQYSKKKMETLQKTAEATNTSLGTVRRIISEAKKQNATFKTPGKKRNSSRKITGINSFDRSIIRRNIHNYYIKEKEPPTIKKLRLKLKNDINFNGSDRSLRRILKDLKFKSRRTENKRKILIEKTNVRLTRIEYINKINKYREEGRPIIYTDESYLDAKSTSKLAPGGYTLELKNPKVQRVMVIYAASETGFIPNALMVYKAEIKPGEEQLTFENYEKWLRCLLIPNLPSNSVVVVDNASYHKKEYNRAPNSNSKISEMKKWLLEKGVEYKAGMLKPQLHKLIKTHKNIHKEFCIDKILSDHNHSVLHLPPFHSDLNPMQLAWTDIKEYVNSKEVVYNTNTVIEIIKEKISSISTNEWQECCTKVKEIEAEYIKNDEYLDMVSEKFIINGDDDKDSDSDDSDNDEDDDDEDDEE